MNYVKFNIIIATRNRADTLKWALKTCIEQNYENLQILISDNNSRDNTKEVVESFNDPRVKYVNTGRDLSMSHNYEFALGHISDGYVTFMGDDDGLMLGALEKANTIINETGYEAIIGKLDEYYWHNCTDVERRGMLRYRLAKKNEELDTEVIRADTLRLKKAYQNLPCIYNVGFISYKVIESVKKKSGGSFFHSCIPDVYSAFALSSEIKKYLFVNTTFILVGISGHSNGIAYFDPKGEKKIVNNFFDLETIPFHNKLEVSPSMAIMYAESYLQAADYGLLEVGYLSLEEVLHTAMDEALTSPYQGNFHKIREAVEKIIEKNNFGEHFKNELFDKYKENQSIIKLIFTKLSRRLASRDKFLQVKTSPVEVLNIYDAVLFNKKLEAKKNISSVMYQLLFLRELIVSGKIFFKKIRIKKNNQ